MKCTFCKNNTHLFDKKYRYCPKCQMIKLQKRYYINPQKEKKQYDNHNNSFECKGYVEMFENFLDFFWNKLPNKKTALDFGSGPNPVLAQIVKNRGFLKVDYFDKFYQPEKIYKNNSYDLITSTEVFEHLDDPLEILKLFKSILNKDGIIAVMTLFHTNNEEDFKNWWYKRDPTHITFFTPHTFEALGDACGLRVVDTDYKRVITLTHA